MKLPLVAVTLTVTNFVLLLLIVSQATSVAAPSTVPVLRGQMLELVDDRGQARARLNVEPDGEVVFRLLDRNGTIRVKLGASENGSGMLLADERTEPAIHMIARHVGTSERPNTTGITMRGGEGQLRSIKP